MLSTKERQEIERQFPHYPDKRALGVEALKAVQKRRGWVSDEALREVAELLQLAAEDLEGIATFYNLIFRRPVGRHVILLCNSVSCWILGYETLREQLQTRLDIGFGQTTADGRFTLLPTCCLGDCNRAPALMIDDQLHDRLNPADLETLLEQYP